MGACGLARSGGSAGTSRTLLHHCTVRTHLGVASMDRGHQRRIAPTRPSSVDAGDPAPDAQLEAIGVGLHGWLQ